MGSVPVATVGSVVGGAASSIIDTIGDGIIYTVVTSLTGVEEDHLAYWLIHTWWLEHSLLSCPVRWGIL